MKIEFAARDAAIWQVERPVIGVRVHQGFQDHLRCDLKLTYPRMSLANSHLSEEMAYVADHAEQSARRAELRGALAGLEIFADLPPVFTINLAVAKQFSAEANTRGRHRLGNVSYNPFERAS